jgi:hypothetical protein
VHLRTVEFNPKETVAFTRPEAGPNDAFFLAKRQVERVPFKHAAVLELKGLETLYGMPVGPSLGSTFSAASSSRSTTRTNGSRSTCADIRPRTSAARACR